MNGYVDQGKSEFQQTVHDYLCDIEISGFPAEMNTFFINSQVVPKGNDVSEFINKLTPRDFKLSSGKKGTTDIAEVFKQVLSRTDENNLSIFISDCIFSPGNVKDPRAYLTNQQIEIKKAFADHIASHQRQAVMVYQMTSNFNGTYYDFNNKPRKLQGERPYYIWVIGHIGQFLSLLTVRTKALDGAKNYWMCYNAFPFDTDYNVLLNPKKGDFQLKAKNTLSKARPAPDGEFMFTIGADLGIYSALLGEDYIEDTANYSRIIERNSNEDLFIELKENPTKSSPATHLISLSTKGYVPKGELQIALRCKTPGWAYEHSDLDDTSFSEDNEGKTYGLKYLFNGIQQAFTARSDNHYLTMNITIN